VCNVLERDITFIERLLYRLVFLYLVPAAVDSKLTDLTKYQLGAGLVITCQLSHIGHSKKPASVG
jgi:hypothetical protein